MSGEPFASFAQNGEDVVLWRALRNVPNGRYVDIGANDPTVDSVSRAFYDAGWRGITVEPVPEYAQRQRAQRPGDIVVEAALTDEPVESVTLHAIPGTGLSTMVDEVGAVHEKSGFELTDITVPTRTLDAVLAEAGWDGQDIHFAVIDVEGAESAVLRSVDLRRWRPWVLVVESTAPRSTRPTQASWQEIVDAADYEFCLFDGLSRFYVAREHAASLRELLSYPACALDNFTTLAHREAARERDAAREELRRARGELDSCISDLIRWRSAAVRSWIDTTANVTVPALRDNHLRAELDAMQQTLSWRVTKPLRAVRTALPRRPR